jgi:ribosomal protein S27AE
MPEKRIHFKGRGKTERETCPECGADLKNIYETYKVDGKQRWRKLGKHCPECDFIRKEGV